MKSFGFHTPESNFEAALCIFPEQVGFCESRPEQKKTLYKASADGLHSAVGLRREDVFISLVEVKKEQIKINIS
jgi:hypothetical protein